MLFVCSRDCVENLAQSPLIRNALQQAVRWDKSATGGRRPTIFPYEPSNRGSVKASRQRELARAIPGAVVHEVDADHAACVNRPELFNQALLQVCWSVAAAPPGIVAADPAS